MSILGSAVTCTAVLGHFEDGPVASGLLETEESSRSIGFSMEPVGGMEEEAVTVAVTLGLLAPIMSSSPALWADSA